MSFAVILEKAKEWWAFGEAPSYQGLKTVIRLKTGWDQFDKKLGKLAGTSWNLIFEIVWTQIDLYWFCW
jgi:hypothetical protein